LQTHLQVHNPQNINNGISTIADVFKDKTPTLVQIKKVYGREWVIDYISAWLIHLNEITNAKNKMPPNSILFVSETIYDDYSVRLADLTLFFKKVRKGDYGDFYENISESKMLSWFQKYYAERCNFAQYQRHKENKEFSSNIDKMNPEVFKEAFKGVGEEEIKHDQKGNGMGTRFKNRLNDE
jgi:hypothetical protein